MIRDYIKKVKGSIILRLLFNGLNAITLALVPIILMDFINGFIDNNMTWEMLALYIAFYVLLLLIGFFLSIGYNYFQFKMRIDFESNIKKDFFNTLCKIDLKEFSKYSIANYISMNNNDITSTTDYVDSYVDMISTFVQLLVYLIIIVVKMSWIIAIVITISCIISVVLSNKFNGELSENRNRYLNVYSEYNETYKNLLESRASINDSVRKQVEAKHSNSQDLVNKSKMDYYRPKAISLSFNGYATYLPNFIAFVTCALLIKNDFISYGVFLATFAFIDSFGSCIEYIQNDIADIISLKDINKRLFNEFSILKDKFISKKDINDFNELSFKDFGIKIKNQNLYSNLNFKLFKNKKYAIVGKNGSGKTCLIKSIIGEINDYNGNIYVDDEDIKNVKIINLISYVGQNSFNFNDSYQNSVSMFGAYDYKKAREIDKEIKGFEDLNFINCTDCSKLSGDEKQLLNFERALISNLPIIIMDEPFSAIDKKRLEQMYQYISKISNKTIIMISHDYKENLSFVDNIIEIKNKSVEIL